MVLEKTLESPLDCKKTNPVNPAEISLEYSLEGLMLEYSPGHRQGDLASVLLDQPAYQFSRGEQ